MNTQPFAVSDKVRLHPAFVCPEVGVTPRLEHDRLYCVKSVTINEPDGQQLLRLVGVECTKDGADAFLRAIHFVKPELATRAPKGGA